MEGFSDQIISQTGDIDHNHLYDVAIIGGGPAGLSAAVYTMRKDLDTVLVTGDIGGQVSWTSAVENYIGYRYIEGNELVDKFFDQVKQFELAYGEKLNVTSIKKEDNYTIELDNGTSVKARCVIVASGKSYRMLNVPGEKELIGRGVAFCVTCDAPLFKGKKVCVVGGGNSGVEAAIDLAKVASDVVLVQFIDRLTADEVLVKKLKEYSNISYIYDSEVVEIIGQSGVEGVRIRDKYGGGAVDIDVKGIFIEIGLIPNSDFVSDLLDLNKDNEIKIDCRCHTNLPGIFAAGDVTDVPYKQIVIAASEGAKAALSAHKYIMEEI